MVDIGSIGHTDPPAQRSAPQPSEVPVSSEIISAQGDVKAKRNVLLEQTGEKVNLSADAEKVNQAQTGAKVIDIAEAKNSATPKGSIKEGLKSAQKSSLKIENLLKSLEKNSDTINKVLGDINQNLQQVATELRIEVDNETDQVIFKVVDRATGEVIKQIPPDELIRMAKKLAAIMDSYSNQDRGTLQLFTDINSIS